MEKYVRVFTKDGRSIGLDRHLGPPASCSYIIYKEGNYTCLLYTSDAADE